MNQAPSVAMTIAGSDNSGGAGIQADIKTFASYHVFGLSAITCVVAEVPGLVSMVEAVSPAIVREQIDLGFRAFPVRAVKTGMLYSTEIVRVVAETLTAQRERGAVFSLVIDPVMVASSGDPLLQADAIEAYKAWLLPLADCVTPNLDEASVLLGEKICDLDDAERAARTLVERFGVPFLVKGGHLQDPVATDFLLSPKHDGPIGRGEVMRFEAPFIQGLSPHGTGCTFSAAIAAELARGNDLVGAVAAGKNYITAAMKEHLLWESGTIILNHWAKTT